MGAPQVMIPPTRRTTAYIHRPDTTMPSYAQAVPPIQVIPQPLGGYPGRPSRLYRYKPRRTARISYGKKKARGIPHV